MRSHPFAPDPNGSETATSTVLVESQPHSIHPHPHPRPSPLPGAPCAVDLVLLSPRQGHLAVFLERSMGEEGEGEGEGEGGRDGAGWTLPWGAPWPIDTTLDACARRIAALALRDADACTLTWLAQVGAFADARQHPGHIDLSIGIVATVPAGNRHDAARRSDARHDDGDGDGAWFTEIPALPARHRAVLDAAVATVRLYIDTAPVAFRLLPATFTLSELQQVYEILLGHRLHKASFRRALLAASLVEATDEWRREGRGRPAQLFRYAPRRRRPPRRGVRFDLVRG